MKIVFEARYGLLCVFLSCILKVQATFAQGDRFVSGYIITSKGDSLNGLILVQSQSLNFKTCGFKEGPESELKTYSPNVISAYGIGANKKYVSHPVKNGENIENVFTACLISGKVSLFFYRGRYFIDSENGFQELVTATTNVTHNEKVISQPLPVYKGVLQNAMNDCSTIHENLKGLVLGKKILIELFEDYNRCVGRSATVYESGDRKIKIVAGIAMSGQWSGLDIQSDVLPMFPYFFNNETMTDFSMAPTFITELYSFRGLGRFRFRTGLSYYTGNYRLYYESNVVGSQAWSNELKINMARIELPVILKYYPLKKVGVYIFAGLGFNASIKWEARFAETIEPFPAFYRDLFKNNSFFTNPMGGLGFDLPLGNRKLFIEGIYARSQPILTTAKGFTGTSTGTLSSITFTTGIVF